MPTVVERKNRGTRAGRPKANRSPQLDTRLLRLLDSTNAVPWEADASTWQFTYIGPQVVRLLGYAAEEWYTRDFWPEHLHPDDREAAVDLCLEQSRCSTDYDFQYRMVAKDGRHVWIHDVVNVEIVSGVPKTLSGFLIDITKEKEAEAKTARMEALFEDLYENAPDIYLSIDVATAKVIRCNETAVRTLGYAKEELIGRPMMSLYHPDCVRQARQVFRSFLGTGDVRDTELRVLRKDGHAIDVSISVSAIRDADGRIIASRSVMRDISRRKQAEREAQERLRQLSHANRISTLGELTASIAHELRQPLTAILTNAQAAERFLSAEPPDLRELRDILADIIKDDRRAGEVIRRLRTLLGSGSGVRTEILNLNQVVAEVLPLLRSDAIIRRVTIATEFESRLPSVYGDRVQLQQVILNLLVNGAEAMTHCGPDDRTMVVRTARQGSEGVVLSVQDCGIGLSEENLEQLFTPFYTTKTHGMGMGLSIARSIIELYEGRLWATKNPDRGATFCFTLPVARTEDA